MDYIIDYLTVTIKPDKKSKHPHNISFNEFVNFLGLSDKFNNFIDLGSRNFYEHCYSYNFINIYSPRECDYYKNGYCVSMSAQGCRFFEEIHGSNCWKFFFQALRAYVESGCCVNIARIDFAFDDIVLKNENRNPLLDLDVIDNCRQNHLFTSLYRKSDKQLHDEFTMKSSIHETITKSIISKTIYFGSRKSNSFCRFYDKFVEQQQKYKNNAAELKGLENIKHWIRFEIVFKNKTAIKIVNSMLELGNEFQNKFAEIINYYIRFINPDNDNRYKCSICKWWSDFLCTVEKSKLTSGKLIKNVFKRSVEWFARSVAPTLFAIECSVGLSSFLDMLQYFGNIDRWKQKHYEISESNSLDEQAISNEMYWKSLIPLFCFEQTKNYVTKQDLIDAVPL